MVFKATSRISMSCPGDFPRPQLALEECGSYTRPRPVESRWVNARGFSFQESSGTCGRLDLGGPEGVIMQVRAALARTPMRQAGKAWNVAKETHGFLAKLMGPSSRQLKPKIQFIKIYNSA